MINKLLVFFIYFVANFIILPQYICAEIITTNTTRPIVPRVAGEGSIGRFDKPWSSGVFSNSISLIGIVIEDF